MDRFKEINQFLDNTFKTNDTVVVAVSGGPDSMCLLDILIKYRNKSNINIVCAHVNHNVREESADELIFVKNYCIENDVTFESMKIEEYSNGNFESEARDKRYDFFKSVINKYNSKYLCTAHHGDDLMETILMRIVRGSNLKGYGGFARITDNNTYKTIRPLINLTKDIIIKYNNTNKVPYVDDYTNHLDTHTRNRYRKYILPRLKMEDKNVNDKFLKFSNIILECNEYLDKIVNNIIGEIYIDGKLDIAKFIEQDHIIQIKIINKLLSMEYLDSITYISDRNVDNIYNLILDSKSNKTINLPLNRRAVKSYNYFYIMKSILKEEYKYSFKNKITLPNGKTIEQVECIDSNSNYVCRLNSNEVELPLIVRNRNNGDKMTIKHMNGSKKVKDILINSKIDIVDRDLYPVVTDSKNNIVWLPGVKKSKYDKQKDEKCDIILKYY